MSTSYLNIDGLRRLWSHWNNSLSNTLETVYPVGSIYMSTAATDPKTLFGFGEWERIEDTFLLASGKRSVGTTGGEETHALTVDELASHDHSFGVVENGTARPNIPTWPESINPGEGETDYWHINWTSQSGISDDFYPYTTWITGITATGGGQAHNNMPPYLTVNVWERVG